METIIEKVSVENIEESVIKKASAVLEKGGLVAFPTETVYGLGANALDYEAASKIYAAKGRPSDNPLIVHISKVDDLYQLSREVPKEALILADAFWPGPLTMVLKKAACVPDGITGGLDTVAVRMPSHKVALKLIEDSGIFIAAPSANLSGRPSPTSAQHVLEDMQGRIDMIIDGGEVNVGIESTIVDLTEDIPTILRPGYITLNDIKACLGEAQIDKGLESGVSAGIAPKAPGMKYRHYAPNGQLTLVTGSKDYVVTKINELADEHLSRNERVAVVAKSENISLYNVNVVKDMGRDATEAAQSLYRILRECDEENIAYIYAEGFEDEDVGQAVMNRMLKAAGHKVIRGDKVETV